MTEQLTVGQLIAALEAIPGNRLVIISGFGIANVPGDVRRHRSHLNDLGIEVVYERMNSKTAERFTMELYQLATQPATMFNPNPTTLDSLAWVRPSGETQQSFFAVTGVDFFKGYAVIRSENTAPVQGPSVQRISDEEMLRRNAEAHASTTDEPHLDPEAKVNRWLLSAIPNERTKVRVRLESARRDLEELLKEIPRIEAESARLDYILGITDTLPETARTGD